MRMLSDTLKELADKYERVDFLQADPSQFMHRYTDPIEQEKAAFVAAALSYGSRKQFLAKIESILDGFIYQNVLPPENDDCFYRLHTNRMVRRFLCVTNGIYDEYGSLLGMMEVHDIHSAIDAIKLITAYFASENASDLIPKNASSSCKRICMFLRWMVRTHSAVDLGLWSNQIKASTLIMPLDTHVLQQAEQLGLITSRTGSMANAIRLTKRMNDIFPDDPTRADYALFGLGVDDNRKNSKKERIKK